MGSRWWKQNGMVKLEGGVSVRIAGLAFVAILKRMLCEQSVARCYCKAQINWELGWRATGGPRGGRERRRAAEQIVR